MGLVDGRVRLGGERFSVRRGEWSGGGVRCGMGLKLVRYVALVVYHSCTIAGGRDSFERARSSRFIKLSSRYRRICKAIHTQEISQRKIPLPTATESQPRRLLRKIALFVCTFLSP